MSRSKIIYSSFLVFYIFAFFKPAWAFAFTDDEWTSVKMCGSVLYGEDPCEYINQVIFNVSYPVSSDKQKKMLIEYIEFWVEKNKKRIYKKINMEIKDMRSGIRSSPAREGEAKIFIMVFPAENSGVVLTLSTETEKVYQAYSYYCASFENEKYISPCFKEKLEHGLEFLMRGFLLSKKTSQSE